MDHRNRIGRYRDAHGNYDANAQRTMAQIEAIHRGYPDARLMPYLMRGGKVARAK